MQHAASIYALAPRAGAARRLSYGRGTAPSSSRACLSARAEEHQAAELARLAGLQPGVGYVVFAIAPFDPVGPSGSPSSLESGPALLESLAAELDGLDEGVVAVARADQVTVLAPAVESGPGPSATVTEVLERGGSRRRGSSSAQAGSHRAPASLEGPMSTRAGRSRSRVASASWAR